MTVRKAMVSWISLYTDSKSSVRPFVRLCVCLSVRDVEL